METKFTKGKWYAVDYAGRFVIQNGETYGDADILSYDEIDGKELCVSQEEAEANAKLIEAAPDLFEACTEALNILNRENIFGKARLLIENAIRKATE